MLFATADANRATWSASVSVPWSRRGAHSPGYGEDAVAMVRVRNVLLRDEKKGWEGEREPARSRHVTRRRADADADAKDGDDEQASIKHDNNEQDAKGQKEGGRQPRMFR